MLKIILSEKNQNIHIFIFILDSIEVIQAGKITSDFRSAFGSSDYFSEFVQI